MKLNITSQRRPDGRRDAFTLMEVLVAVMIMGVTFVTYYLGMTQSYALVQVARENLRATQILQEKMETIRLYTWDQLVNSPGFIPATFTAAFYPAGSQTNQGVAYQGTFTLTNAPSTITGPYTSDLRMVIFTLNWTSGAVQRQREMRTLVSHYGLHNYIYQ
jgi:prepilin-type N-terminal cleavage/methylation domain-containing protein